MSTPSGWYPDPSGTPRSRWWDGTQWTENYHDPVASTPAVVLTAPEGTPVYNTFTYILIALVFVAFLPLLLIDWNGYLDAVIGSMDDPYAASTAQFAIFTPGYFIALILGWVITAGKIVVAFFDHRELTRAGVPRPFHWAFAFLGDYVYLIGRGVVARRRTGRGFATVWVAIGYIVLSFVFSIGLIVWMVTTILDSVPYSSY
jgi:hypothetical protein